jgi:hypothetical protein
MEPFVTRTGSRFQKTIVKSASGAGPPIPLNTPRGQQLAAEFPKA